MKKTITAFYLEEWSSKIKNLDEQVDSVEIGSLSRWRLEDLKFYILDNLSHSIHHITLAISMISALNKSEITELCTLLSEKQFRQVSFRGKGNKYLAETLLESKNTQFLKTLDLGFIGLSTALEGRPKSGISSEFFYQLLLKKPPHIHMMKLPYYDNDIFEDDPELINEYINILQELPKDIHTVIFEPFDSHKTPALERQFAILATLPPTVTTLEIQGISWRYLSEDKSQNANIKLPYITTLIVEQELFPMSKKQLTHLAKMVPSVTTISVKNDDGAIVDVEEVKQLKKYIEQNRTIKNIAVIAQNPHLPHDLKMHLAEFLPKNDAIKKSLQRIRAEEQPPENKTDPNNKKNSV